MDGVQLHRDLQSHYKEAVSLPTKFPEITGTHLNLT